ncbi:MAG: hypothetical protein KJZ69_02880 [Phycisphaerales bacterium]|nr:hypothetical protein [Phycisphaerales bacterium]
MDLTLVHSSVGRILLCALVLLLGLLANAVLAWRSAGQLGTDPARKSSEIGGHEAEALWTRFVAPLKPEMTADGFRVERPGAMMVMLDPFDRAQGRQFGSIVLDYEMCTIVTAGWPFLSFEGSVHHLGNAAGVQSRLSGMISVPERIAGLAIPSIDVPPDRVLPVGPIWFGLLANTVLYAVPFAVLVWAIGLFRRRVRFLRGRCPSCGYDLRGSTDRDGSRCPECGRTAGRRP